MAKGHHCGVQMGSEYFAAERSAGISGLLPAGFKMTKLGPLPEEWRAGLVRDVVRGIKGWKARYENEK